MEENYNITHKQSFAMYLMSREQTDEGFIDRQYNWINKEEVELASKDGERILELNNIRFSVLNRPVN